MAGRRWRWVSLRTLGTHICTLPELGGGRELQPPSRSAAHTHKTYRVRGAAAARLRRCPLRLLVSSCPKWHSCRAGLPNPLSVRSPTSGLSASLAPCSFMKGVLESRRRYNERTLARANGRPGRRAFPSAPALCPGASPRARPLPFPCARFAVAVLDHRCNSIYLSPQGAIPTSECRDVSDAPRRGSASGWIRDIVG